MESVGIEVTKLASLYFTDVSAEASNHILNISLDSAFYEVYKASLELPCIADEDRVDAFKKYPRHSLQYLQHLARFADLGFTTNEVAKVCCNCCS